jgi:translation initiation factor 2 gamma subunit (eIF-2gamma)
MLLSMATDSILAQIDSEIARLQQARKLLANIGTATKSAGRNAVKAATAKPAKKRKISAEGRKRIAEAQRKRWAAQRAKAKKKP